MAYSDLAAIGDATKKFAVDLISGRIFSRTKISFGIEDVATEVTRATPFPVEPIKAPVAYTAHNGAITTAGTAVEAMPANAARRILWVQNTSANDIRVNEVALATITAGILLAPGQVAFWEDGTAPTTAISVWGGTAGQSFGAREA